MTSQILVQDVQAAAIEVLEVTRQQLVGDTRNREVAKKRHIAMAAASIITGRSHKYIAERFRRDDHTTLSHAVDRVTRERVQDGGYIDGKIAEIQEVSARKALERLAMWRQVAKELEARQ